MTALEELAGAFVREATAQGHSVAAIEAAMEKHLVRLRNQEERAYMQQFAKGLTFAAAENALTYAMAEDWEPEDMDQLQEALRIRFPNHHKSIDNIFEQAGDVSNEREEMHDGPSAEFEHGYEEVVDALTRLPWPQWSE